MYPHARRSLFLLASLAACAPVEVSMETADSTEASSDTVTETGSETSGDGDTGDGDGTSGDGTSGDGTSGDGDGTTGDGDGSTGDGTTGDGDGTTGDGTTGDGTTGDGDGTSGDGDGTSGDGDGTSGDGTTGDGDGTSGDGTTGDGDGTSGDGDGTSGDGDGTSGDGDGTSGDGDGDGTTGDGDGTTGDGDGTTGDGDGTTGDGDGTTGDGDGTSGDGDGDGGLPLGDSCASNAECASLFCYATNGGPNAPGICQAACLPLGGGRCDDLFDCCAGSACDFRFQGQKGVCIAVGDGDGDGDGDGTSGDGTTGDGTTGDGDGTTGDGDGTTGDGDGTTGDGDGTTGDGDGTTGDGDGDVPPIPYCDEVANWDPQWAALEVDILNQTNAVRATGYDCVSGYQPPAPPLTMHPALRCSARKHSLDMATNDYFAHTNLMGQSPFQRMNLAGYSYSAASENIAAGNSSATATLGQWLGSASGHCEALMSPNYVDLGVGYAQGGSFGHYWTQNFGRP